MENTAIGNVWVFIEQEGGKIAGVSLELVSRARELADRLGKAGSPTNVKHILSVVLTAGNFQEVAPTQEAVGNLVHELIEDHTLG